MTTTPEYPRYGRMIVEWESLIGPPETGGPAPDAWDPKGTPWRAWREGISDLLSHVLWPRYVKGAGWVGPADKFKHDLTLADFDLFQILRPLLGGDETLPNGKTVPQRKLFVLEDEASPTGSNRRRSRLYSATICPALGALPETSISRSSATCRGPELTRWPSCWGATSSLTTTPSRL
jgi:hypothetical protein